jgi:adenylate cyclase class IV
MSSALEVELRGPIPADELLRIKAMLESEGSFKGTKNRYMVHFDPERTKKDGLDVRARITNGSCELMVKKGDMGGGVRSEYPVPCADGSFVALCKALVAMGFTTGVGCHRVSDRYQIGDMEFAIIHVPGHSSFYEAELEVPEDEIDAAKTRINTWLTEHRLRVYSKEEFDGYVETLDKEANDALDFETAESWTTVENIWQLKTKKKES